MFDVRNKKKVIRSYHRKMFMLLEMCCVCLANTNNLKQIDLLDIDNIKIVRKLEYCTTKCKNIRPAIPLYICLKCCQELRIAYEFKKSYYRSCKLLKGYVSQLKQNKNYYSNKMLQKELQVKITNLGECMIDGKFSRDLVKIENVETHFVDTVPESDTAEIVTNTENTVTDRMVNNLIEENFSLEYNNNDHLDVEDVKLSADLVKLEETAVDNQDDISISEEKEDMCKIWVENKNGNTLINYATSVMQQSVEILQDINGLDNEESIYCRSDTEIDKSQLNLVLEGIAKSEDTGDICKIWVENTKNKRLANADTVSSIVNESANVKQEITVPENTNTDTGSSIVNESANVKQETTVPENSDTDSSIVNESANVKQETTVPENVHKENAHVKRMRKKMKYSNMLSESSCDITENNNNVPKCMHCNKTFTYKIDLLNFLIMHSCNKPFCSTFCREQYDKMCSLRA